MSETINDDMLLNDDNDEDLDYDLDPNEEHALLQEDSDLLEQDFEEDVLDLNEDYDQMDVNDDKSSGKVSNDSNILINNEKKNLSQTSNNPKNISLRRGVRGLRRGNKNKNSYPLRRSKTVLINPRFKGPVHVNSNQYAWDSSPCNTYEPPRNQQLIQPWVNGNVQNHLPPPMNTFTRPPFIPPNQGAFLSPQINTNYIPPPLQQPIQPFLQPQPVPNQHLLLNQPLMQLNPCPNQFHFQAPPQIPPLLQQFPEQQKLPVHQRLGIPSNGHQSNVLIQTPNNQTQFNGNQNLQPNNNFMIPQNFNQNQMSNNQHNPFQNNIPALFPHSNFKPFHTNQQYRKNGGNFKNNNKVVNVRNNFIKKRDIVTEKLEVNKDVQEVKEEKKETCIDKIPDDEDEETREYRKKIEEQKRKREEILRKKEESRRKNLAAETPQIVTKPNNRSFQPKKFNFSHHPHLQQNKQHKLQTYTNNIVITGSDNHQFGQRNNLVPINNFAQPNRIILPNKIHSSTEQVKSEDIASFLSTRSVISQDNLSQTNIVVVKNLALATNETKIMQLCRDIGTVQKLQMEKNEHQATIQFNTVASAHAFYNKFRRRMIDLSMVQVDLVPFNSP